MNRKLSAVLIVVMIYIQFMGPFVLKANFEGQTTIRSLTAIKREANMIAREVKNDLNELKNDLTNDLSGWKKDTIGLVKDGWNSHNPFLIVLSIIGAAFMTCVFLITRVLIIAWFLFKSVLKAVGYVLEKTWDALVFVFTGRWWRRALTSPRDPNSRFRSLTNTNPEKKARTPEEQKELQDQINMYIDIIGKRIGLTKIENEAAETGFFSGKWAKKMWNSVTGDKGGKILPAMNNDEMKMALRDLYDIEMNDLIEMKKELDKISNQPGVPALEYHNNCRRKRNHYLELRIGRATDLINTNMYQDNKYKSTLEYKKTIFPMEIAAIEKILSDKKTPDNVRETESNKLKEILQRKDPKKDTETVNKENAKMSAYFYNVAGINRDYLFKKFFFAYNSASYVVILRKEKATIDMEETTRSMTADQKETNEESRKKLQESIDKLMSSMEFR